MPVPTLSLRTGGFILLALLASSARVPPPRFGGGAAAAAAASSLPSFVTPLCSSTTRRSSRERVRQHRRWASHPSSYLVTTERRSFGANGRGDLLATSAGGDENVSTAAIMDPATAAAAAAADDVEERDDSTTHTSSPHLTAYWNILRPQNIPSAAALVLAGALISTHTTDVFFDPKVLLTSFAAAAVSVGSCVLNDWFDIELDRVNEPDRPLVTGEVVPAHALGIGLGFLLAAVASASAVDPAALQATIVASVALTLAYTPLLKPIPLVKNVVVATVIGGAIAAGGLAAGAGVAATLTPSLLTFFVIAHREILMDITDLKGDRDAGVRTLPVVLGREVALALAAALLTVGVFVAGVGVVGGTAVSTRPAVLALSALFVLPLYGNLLNVRRSSYSYEALSSAVGQAIVPLALVLGVMGFVLR